MNEKSSISIFQLLIVVVTTAEIVEESTNNAKCADLANCSQSNESSMFCNTPQRTTVPTCIGNIETLIISSGNIQRLRSSDFSLAFKSLKILALRNIFLKRVHENTFENLLELVDLDLSFNFLRSLDPELFTRNFNLERLNLSFNLMRRLVAKQFALPNLKILDLSGCSLEIVDDTAFFNATSLQWLSLRKNKLRSLPPLQINFSVVTLLSDNPWNCDCAMYSAIRRYSADGIINKSACFDVEKNQFKPWKDTGLSEDICADEILSENFAWTKKERNLREDEAPELIITIYGYVFVTLSVLIFMCCCCDKPKAKLQIPICTG